VETAAARRWRLVVVDDEPSVRAALAALLARDGVEVSTAADRPAAERLFAGDDIDLLLTDLRLGGRDDASGLGLVRWAKAAHPRALCVVLTAHASEELRAEARRLGAHDVWPKSMTIPALVDRLRELGLPLPAMSSIAEPSVTGRRDR
jgi:DNA-binding response OmpR family regulator